MRPLGELRVAILSVLGSSR